MTLLLLAKGKAGAPSLPLPYSYLRARPKAGLAELLEPLEATDQATTDSILILDRSAFGQRHFDSLVAELAAGQPRCWLVLDQANQVADPAALFQAGASDYWNAYVLEQGIGLERLEQAAALGRKRSGGRPGRTASTAAARTAAKATAASSAAQDSAAEARQRTRGQRPSFPGWTKIREGSEYSFIFLYVDLPEADSVRRILGEKRYIRLKEDFVVNINQLIRRAEGRAWMSDGHSLLALIPPTQADLALRLAVETMLGASLFLYEQLGLTTPTALRFALHCGRSIWQKPGKTGTIISEDINFIHHLGRKFTKKNQVVVSGAVYDLLSQRYRGFLKAGKDFEGHQTHHYQ